MEAELSPVTDRPLAVAALSEMLSHKVIPATGSVIAFDMSTVSVDVGSIPIDEVLSFRKENFAAYRTSVVTSKPAIRGRVKTGH